ncbi:MAG: hypothetical protein ACTTJ2_03620 [Anaerovoracaceae bacterium]
MNITIIDADKIRREALEKFGVDAALHAPCGAKGFFFTLEEADSQVTDYIAAEIFKLGGTTELADEGKTLVYKF